MRLEDRQPHEHWELWHEAKISKIAIWSLPGDTSVVPVPLTVRLPGRTTKRTFLISSNLVALNPKRSCTWDNGRTPRVDGISVAGASITRLRLLGRRASRSSGL